MKRRDKFNGIYTELMSIKNDDNFLAAVSATDVKIMVFLMDFRYSPLHSRVAKLQKERRAKYGSVEEKEKWNSIDKSLEELLCTDVSEQDEAKLSAKIITLANTDTQSDYSKKFTS
jgi:hypothetical protein